ncbi:MAG: epoxide hydrolase family protein, partial [Luminiphilus sp.]
MTAPIHPYEPSVDEEVLRDLTARLGNTRFPDEETVEDWSQGIPLAYVRELTDYWRDDYNMARAVDSLKQWPNFTTEIEGLQIHFLYQRSPHSDATPLLLTHGWPGSVLEFRHLIDRLTQPTDWGGQAEDAFHVVVPSLPGYGFSGKPRNPGTGVQKIAELWIALMARLGHERFLAHGGDWGSLVTQAIATTPGTTCAGIHITLPVVAPDPETLDNPLPE